MANCGRKREVYYRSWKVEVFTTDVSPDLSIWVKFVFKRLRTTFIPSGPYRVKIKNFMWSSIFIELGLEQDSCGITVPFKLRTCLIYAILVIWVRKKIDFYVAYGAPWRLGTDASGIGVFVAQTKHDLLQLAPRDPFYLRDPPTQSPKLCRET